MRTWNMEGMCFKAMAFAACFWAMLAFFNLLLCARQQPPSDQSRLILHLHLQFTFPVIADSRRLALL